MSHSSHTIRWCASRYGCTSGFLLAGCGGLATGLIQADIVTPATLWAVDSWRVAGDSLNVNYKEAKVVRATCGAFLRRYVEFNTPDQDHCESLICDRQTAEAAEKIPQHLIPKMDEIDMVVAGPNCQV